MNTSLEEETRQSTRQGHRKGSIRLSPAKLWRVIFIGIRAAQRFAKVEVKLLRRCEAIFWNASVIPLRWEEEMKIINTLSTELSERKESSFTLATSVVSCRTVASHGLSISNKRVYEWKSNKIMPMREKFEKSNSAKPPRDLLSKNTKLSPKRYCSTSESADIQMNFEISWKLRNEDLFTFSVDEFKRKLIRNIGSGASASVFLGLASKATDYEIIDKSAINTSDADNIEPLAIKIMSKPETTFARLLSRSEASEVQTENAKKIRRINNELNILKTLSNLRPEQGYFTSLRFSFETTSHLILGLEYCEGNNLHKFMCLSFLYGKDYGSLSLPNIQCCLESATNGHGIEPFAKCVMPDVDLKKGNIITKQTFGLDIFVVRNLLRQILKGLEFLHENNILYRDLKPQNILLNRRGEIKLCDFGVSGFGVRDESGNFHLRSRSFVGSVEYMSPEMIRGDSQTTSMDLFQAGCVAYELAYGFSPFNYYIISNGSTSFIKEKIYAKILNCNHRNAISYRFNNAGCSKEEISLKKKLVSLIKRILVVDVDSRLKMKDVFIDSFFTFPLSPPPETYTMRCVKKIVALETKLFSTDETIPFLFPQQSEQDLISQEFSNNSKGNVKRDLFSHTLGVGKKVYRKLRANSVKFLPSVLYRI